MAASATWGRTFAVFWVGQFVAVTGVDVIALMMSTELRPALTTPVLRADSALLLLLPFVVCSPAGGALADRWGPRRALLVANGLGVLNLAVLGLLYALDVLPIGRAVLFLAVSAALKALHLSAYEAAVPLIVPKRNLGRANGTRMFVTGVGGVAGLVVAEPLLDAAGPTGVVLLGCATYALAIVSLCIVAVPGPQRPADATAAPGGLTIGFLEACRYLAARPGMIVLLVLLVVANVGVGVSEQLVEEMTLAFASVDELTVVLLSGFLGLTVATVAMVVWGVPRRLGTGTVVFLVAAAAAMVAGSLRPNVALLAVATSLFLGCVAVVVGTVQTLWQLKTEPHLLGRTASIKNAVIETSYITTGIVTGLVVVPMVAGVDHVGVLLTVLVGDGPGRAFAVTEIVVGVLVAACAILGLRRAHLRRLEFETSDTTAEDLATRPVAQAQELR